MKFQILFWKYVCVFHLHKVFGSMKISYPLKNFCGENCWSQFRNTEWVCHVFYVPQRWLCTVHLYLRRGGGTDKWGRKLECWPWLVPWPAQLEDSGPVGVIFTMMDTGKGNPCCLTWQELLSCVYLAIQLLLYNTYEFGHDADQSQHSSLRPHW